MAGKKGEEGEKKRGINLESSLRKGIKFWKGESGKRNRSRKETGHEELVTGPRKLFQKMMGFDISRTTAKCEL